MKLKDYANARRLMIFSHYSRHSEPQYIFFHFCRNTFENAHSKNKYFNDVQHQSHIFSQSRLSIRLRLHLYATSGKPLTRLPLGELVV